MTSSRIIFTSSIIAFALGCLAASLFAQVGRIEVVKVKLPLELPALGNIESASKLRFGRIETVVQVGAANDLKMKIRTEDGNVLEAIAPRGLNELARASNWAPDQPAQDQPSAPDYVERMVAFDADKANRIIALISLEPISRDRERLRP